MRGAQTCFLNLLFSLTPLLPLPRGQSRAAATLPSSRRPQNVTLDPRFDIPARRAQTYKTMSATLDGPLRTVPRHPALVAGERA